jgi:hypothetical protein
LEPRRGKLAEKVVYLRTEKRRTDLSALKINRMEARAEI